MFTRTADVVCVADADRTAAAAWLSACKEGKTSILQCATQPRDAFSSRARKERGEEVRESGKVLAG